MLLFLRSFFTPLFLSSSFIAQFLYRQKKNKQTGEQFSHGRYTESSTFLTDLFILGANLKK
jgi:hypothetical protein